MINLTPGHFVTSHEVEYTGTVVYAAYREPGVPVPGLVGPGALLLAAALALLVLPLLWEHHRS